MKIRYIVILVCLWMGGCLAPSVNMVAMQRLNMIQDPKGPATRNEIIDGKEYIMAKRGLWFIEEDARSAVVSLMMLHKNHGSWPIITQVENKIKTRIGNHGEYLRLGLTNSELGEFAYVSKDGYMSIDGKFSKVLQDIEAALTRPEPSGAPFPPIFIK